MSGRYAGVDRRSFHSTGQPQQQHYGDAMNSGSQQSHGYQDGDETNISDNRQTHSSPEDHRRQRQDNHQPQQQKQPPSRSMSGASSVAGAGAGGGGRGVRQRGATWREANAAGGPARRMEMAIPQSNLRVFASAVQCLVKVGKELFIEATADQLILRTLNDAKSAFAAFYFNDAGGFFENFRCDTSSRSGDGRSQDGCDTTQGSAAGGGGGGSVSCKVPVRAVHSIFRTLKKVVRLVVYMEGEDEDHIEPNLVFQMYCEYGYRKVHRFSLQDCEIMHAVFEGEGASRLSCPPVQLSQLLEHIHGTAEVAVGASHDVLTVRSFHHPLTGSAERAVLKTEMSISTAEFDTYRFCGADDEEVELVFSLKEIKSLLHFCDTTEAQSLEILFREGGDPLLFQSHSKAFAAELIMATMEPRIVRKEEDQRPAQQPARTSSNDRGAAAAAGGPSVSHGSAGNQQSAPGGEGRGSSGGGAADNWEQERGGGPPEGRDEDYDPQYEHHGDQEQHRAQNGRRIGERPRKRSRDPREQEDEPQGQNIGGDNGILQGGVVVGRRRHPNAVEDDQDSESTRSPGSASGDNPILDGNLDERQEWEGEVRSRRRRKGFADDDNNNDHGNGDGQSNGSDNISISGRRRGRSSSRRREEERGPGGRLERDLDPQAVGDGGGGGSGGSGGVDEYGDGEQYGDADHDDGRERTGNRHSELPTQFPGLRAAFDSAPSSQHSSANLLAVVDEREKLSTGGGIGTDDGGWGIRDTGSRSRKRRYVQEDEEEEEEDRPNSDLRL